MKTILKIAAATIALVAVVIVDIPLLPLKLVPDAQAFFYARRRTAVVAYSAGAAEAEAAAMASQQRAIAAQQEAAMANQEAAEAREQAAASQQQAAAAKQQAAAAKSASTVPIGTIVKVLPKKCESVVINNAQYYDCGGNFYKAAFQGNNLVYVTVKNPI